MRDKPGLSTTMSQTQFDNGYWYVTELKTFAAELGIPRASGMRKDELELAIKHFLRTGEIPVPARRTSPSTGLRDTERGLRLSLPVVRYTNDKATKDFLFREASKIDPNFKIKSGTRYPLNRWREDQIAEGRKITYGDLVRHFVKLNQSKKGPLRTEHGRYINFVSDFMAANKNATREQMLKAWEELKKMDAPKTYESWAERRGQARSS